MCSELLAEYGQPFVFALTPDQVLWLYEQYQARQAVQRLSFIWDLSAVVASAFGGKEGSASAQKHCENLAKVSGATYTEDKPVEAEPF